MTPITPPLQGSTADIIKLAMLAVDNVLPLENAAILFQMYDKLVFEFEANKADAIGESIKTFMQDVLSDTAKQIG